MFLRLLLVLHHSLLHRLCLFARCRLCRQSCRTQTDKFLLAMLVLQRPGPQWKEVWLALPCEGSRLQHLLSLHCQQQRHCLLPCRCCHERRDPQDTVLGPWPGQRWWCCWSCHWHEVVQRLLGLQCLQLP